MYLVAFSSLLLLLLGQHVQAVERIVVLRTPHTASSHASYRIRGLELAYDLVNEVPPEALLWGDNVNLSIASGPSVPWNLDRLDGVMDDKFELPYEDFTGNLTDIYVVDTGVRADHVTLYPRVSSDGYQVDENGTDCNGHGTLVASIAAGKIYGIARGATVIPVNIMNCNGMGSLIQLVEAVQWILQRVAAHPERKAVVNLSLQASVTGVNAVMNHLVDVLYQAGVIVVVAAGNRNGDACDYSPSSSKQALTVGATDETDAVLAGTNTGPCVTVYAPGADICGASARSPFLITERSGTSMSTAHVTGICAALWSKHPEWTHQHVMSYFLTQMTVMVNETRLAQVTISNETIMVTPAEASKCTKTVLTLQSTKKLQVFRKRQDRLKTIFFTPLAPVTSAKLIWSPDHLIVGVMGSPSQSIWTKRRRITIQLRGNSTLLLMNKQILTTLPFAVHTIETLTCQ